MRVFCADETLKRIKNLFDVSTNLEFVKHLPLKEDGTQLSDKTPSSWKQKNVIPLDILLFVANKFDVSIDWLLYGETPEPQRDQLTTMALEELAHLNDQQKFKVVSFIKALREEGNSLHAHNQFNQNNIGVVAEQIHQPIKQTFK